MQRKRGREIKRKMWNKTKSWIKRINTKAATLRQRQRGKEANAKMLELQERAIACWGIEVEMVMNILSIAKERTNGRKLMVSVHDMASVSSTDLFSSPSVSFSSSLRFDLCAISLVPLLLPMHRCISARPAIAALACANASQRIWCGEFFICYCW